MPPAATPDPGLAQDWLAALNACHAAGTPCVLVTVLETSGSLPQRAGAKMLVTAAGSAGSVGGGGIERRATARARELLTAGAALCCEPLLSGDDGNPVDNAAAGRGHVRAGARLTLLYEPLYQRLWRVQLFGAGHVGRALVAALSPLGCRVDWIDSRAEAFPASFPDHVVGRVADAPEQAVADAPPGGFYVLCSHRHELDFRVAEAVLKRADARFLGMIGSAAKRAQFERYLQRRGAPAAQWRDRLVCPIGLPQIKGRSPAEIAVAIVAQLLIVRDGG